MAVRLLWSLLCFLWVTPVLAVSDNRQQELSELRERIQTLHRELEQASEDRTQVADELKKSERIISDVNRNLRDLTSKQQGLFSNLKTLRQDARTTETEITRQRQRLQELLRQRYIHGDNDTMKLLLNGQTPSETTRNLEYYGYIGRARAELIREHQRALARLDELQRAIQARQTDLEQVKHDQMAQKKSLEQEKVERQGVLTRLSSQIRRQRNEIRTLEQDEKRLTQLIERLARLAAAAAAKKPPAPGRRGQKVEQVADASLAGLAFDRLRGKLALPVAGEILHRFGQERPGGGPVWKGLFIRAKQGLGIRAVGSGKVAFADWLRGFGNLLIVDHGGGYLSLYSNTESLYKQPGDVVRAGDLVAAVGATGGQDEPGLYFELRHQGKPFDPMEWVR